MVPRAGVGNPHEMELFRKNWGQVAGVFYPAMALILARCAKEAMRVTSQPAPFGGAFRVVSIAIKRALNTHGHRAIGGGSALGVCAQEKA